MNATQSFSSRRRSTSAWLRPLLLKNWRKATSRRGLFVPRHKKWTWNQWTSVLWVDEPKFEIFGSTSRVCVMQTRWRICLSIHPSVTLRLWGRRCDVQRWFAGDTEDMLKRHGNHSSDKPAYLWLAWPVFIFQWPQWHLQAVWGRFIKEGEWGVLPRTTRPSQPPDLNPTEMVCSEMDRKGRRVNKCSESLGTPSRLLKECFYHQRTSGPGSILSCSEIWKNRPSGLEYMSIFLPTFWCNRWWKIKHIHTHTYTHRGTA